METNQHRVTINIPTLLSSKDEEIATVQKLATALTMHGAQSYLSHLFSPGFVDWMKHNIRNDFPCDLFTAYCDANGETIQREAEVANLAGQVAQLQTQIAVLTEQLDDHAAERKCAIKHRDEYKRQISQLTDDLQRAQWENDDKDREIKKLRDMVCELESVSYSR